MTPTLPSEKGSRVPPRVWILRIKSGEAKGTAVSWDGPPSNAYIPYVPEELLREARAEAYADAERTLNCEMRIVVDSISSFPLALCRVSNHFKNMAKAAREGKVKDE